MSTDSCDNTDTEDLRRSSTQPRSNLWSMLSRPAPDVQKKMFLCNAIQSLHRPESHYLIYKIQRMPEVIDESESLDNLMLLLDKCGRTARRAQSSKNTAGLRLSVFSTFTRRMATKKAQKGSELVKSCSETLSHPVLGAPEETLESFKTKSVRPVTRVQTTVTCMNFTFDFCSQIKGKHLHFTWVF